MNNVYLILAHTNPKQLKRLLNILHNDIFVHIDKKAKIEDYYVKEENIIYIQNRVNVNWGGYSMVQATLNLINESYKNKKYDYFTLLSGLDYPIKDENSFNKYLKMHYPCNYIEYSKINDNNDILKNRYLKYKLFDKRTYITRFIQKLFNYIYSSRKPYKNLVMYKGSQWWCLSREGIEYVLNYINKNKSVINYFKHTDIPDEMIFQSILLSSRNLVIRNDNLRYIRLYSYHPDILMSSDYSKLKSMNKKFFARKFDENKDEEILNMLDNDVITNKKYYGKMI